MSTDGEETMSRRKMRDRRPYPKQRKREMTPAWKAEVLRWIESRDISIPRFAVMLKVDRKSVWQALTTDQQTSSIVDPVCQLTGIVAPTLPSKNDALDDVIKRIPEEHRGQAADILRAALGDKLRGK